MAGTSFGEFLFVAATTCILGGVAAAFPPHVEADLALELTFNEGDQFDVIEVSFDGHNSLYRDLVITQVAVGFWADESAHDHLGSLQVIGPLSRVRSEVRIERGDELHLRESLQPQSAPGATIWLTALVTYQTQCLPSGIYVDEDCYDLPSSWALGPTPLQSGGTMSLFAIKESPVVAV